MKPRLVQPTAPLLESAVQREVVAFYKMLGIKVFNLSQGYRPGGKRHGTTRQTKGLGDLYCIWPDRHITFWHETKRVGGKQTPEQLEFQRLNDLVGVTVVVGGLVAASDFVAHVRNVQTDPWPTPEPTFSTEDVSRWLWNAGTYREGGYIAPARDVLREASEILRSDQYVLK